MFSLGISVYSNLKLEVRDKEHAVTYQQKILRGSFENRIYEQDYPLFVCNSFIMRSIAV